MSLLPFAVRFRGSEMATLPWGGAIRGSPLPRSQIVRRGVDRRGSARKNIKAALRAPGGPDD